MAKKNLHARLNGIRVTLTGPKARAKLARMIVRVYTAGILLVLVWCGYLSVAYLVRTVFFPPALPLEVEKWPGSLDVAALRSDTAAGVERPAPRAPLSHFHRVDQWLQQDKLNGCTLIGCHQPLPHDIRAKVPAFANFHTTFLACQMCHQPAEKRPGLARWVNIQTGNVQDSPAILRLLKMLETETDVIAKRPADVQVGLTSLLGQSISDVGGDPLLDELLAQIQSSEPGSPVWRQAVLLLTAELPQHARGEYQAKLIWSGLAGSAPERLAQLTDQAAQFNSAADEQRKAAIKKEIHAPLAAQPAKCLACHDDQPGMLDFTAAGFSPKRSDYLSKLEIARLMQQIRQGEQFYLPNLNFGQ